MSRTPKEGKESKSHRVRTHTIMGQEEVGAGKKSFWPELEITGEQASCCLSGCTVHIDATFPLNRNIKP